MKSSMICYVSYMNCLKYGPQYGQPLAFTKQKYLLEFALITQTCSLVLQSSCRKLLRSCFLRNMHMFDVYGHVAFTRLVTYGFAVILSRMHCLLLPFPLCHSRTYTHTYAHMHSHTNEPFLQRNHKSLKLKYF